VSPRGHLLVAGVVWVVLSAIGVLLVIGMQIIPVIASKEAVTENEAFVVLTAVSVPVLMLVVVALVYSALRFRAGDEATDGPPVHGHTGLQAAWVGISLVMVLGLFVYGTVGLMAIRGAQTADFEVKVSAEQWAWHYEYPASGARADELHIPVNRRTHIALASGDVIHSFWVPALGVKQDAVPGHPTEIYVTATEVGTYPGMCAELCGLGHTTMTTTVVVSDAATLEAWLRDAARDHGPEPSPK
jgi:cytochrome c oxidase subunit II